MKITVDRNDTVELDVKEVLRGLLQHIEATRRIELELKRLEGGKDYSLFCEHSSCELSECCIRQAMAVIHVLKEQEEEETRVDD